MGSPPPGDSTAPSVGPRLTPIPTLPESAQTPRAMGSVPRDRAGDFHTDQESKRSPVLLAHHSPFLGFDHLLAGSESPGKHFTSSC